MTQTLLSSRASGYHTRTLLANGSQPSKSIQCPFGTWQAHAGPGHPLSRKLTKLDERLGIRLGSGGFYRLGTQQQGWRRGFGGEGVGREGETVRGRRRTITAIGFTADPRPSVEKAAARLLRDAAALLVYQEVFKGAAPQAFLRLLLQLRRSDDPLRVLESYGEFYRLMAFEEHSSWEDLLLHRILTVENNPFAEAAAAAATTAAVTTAAAAAAVSAGDSTILGGKQGKLRAAAAVDLSSLQRLCVNETTLASWVADIVPDMPGEWREAAAAANGVAKGSRDRNGAGEARVMGFDLTAASKEALTPAAPAASAASSSSSSEDLLPPRISGMWDWADALPLIHAFHAANGYGEAAVSSVLEWKGGRFVAAATELVTPPPSPLFSIYNEQREALRGLVHTHVDGRPSPHVLLHGPPGTGKSTLLRSILLPMALPSSALLSIPPSDSPLTSHLTSTLAEEEAGEGSSRGRRELRVVLLQKGDVKGIAGVLQAAAKMPSLRFCLLIDNLNLRAGEEALIALRQVLHSSFPFPSNVQLLATSLSPDLIRPPAAPSAPPPPPPDVKPTEVHASESSNLSEAGQTSSVSSSSTVSSNAFSKGKGEIGTHFAFTLHVGRLNPQQLQQCLSELIPSALAQSGSGAGRWEGAGEAEDLSLISVIQAARYHVL
ncbi:unnamed protein product [Closterium sp. NIES-54]